MFDTATPLPRTPAQPPVAQRPERSHGRAEIALSNRAGRVRLDRLAQQGSGKAFLPRTHGAMPEVVFLNTSGGLTGGDHLTLGLSLGAETSASATTQTAERAYRSTGATPARVEVALSVGAGGVLHWIPQETILFEDSNLHRSTTADLCGPKAALLMLETVVLGRHAMGETPARARLRDCRMIRRDGRPVWAETLHLDAGTLALANAPAVLGGARALAVLALVAPGAEDAAQALRPVLDEPDVEAAASGFDGKCLVRLLARDGMPLRRQVLRALAVLRRGAPMPRVWPI